MIKLTGAIMFATLALASTAQAHPGHALTNNGIPDDRSGLVNNADQHLADILVRAIGGAPEALRAVNEEFMPKHSAQVFRTLQHINDFTSRDIEAKDVSYFMIYLIKEQHPTARHYWADSSKWDGINIKKSSGKIDPEYVPLSSASLKEVQSHGMTHLQATPFVDAAEFAMTNRHRMRQGMAPIGPDNRFMQVCRLVRQPDATYYELVQSDARTLIDLTQSGMKLSQACLSSKVMESYWKNRELDFETPYGEELSEIDK